MIVPNDPVIGISLFIGIKTFRAGHFCGISRYPTR